MDAVLAYRGDMRVAVVPCQDRQQQGREHRALARGMVALVLKRTVRDPAIKQPADLQKLNEERQLSQRCDGSRRIPFHVDPAPERIDRDRRLLARQRLVCCFTHRVSPTVIGNAPLTRSQ